MSDFFDRFISDLVKGAEASEGFARNSRVGVQVAREPRGYEQKLAAHASTLAGGVPIIGPTLAGLNAAANDESMGSGLLTQMGSSLGQVGGGVGGALLGGAAGGGLANALHGDEDVGRSIGALVGGAGGAVGGGMLGAAGGRALSGDKTGALNAVYARGVSDAASAFKVAFVGGLARAALPIAANVGGAAAAGKYLPQAFKGGVRDAAAQVAGGLAADKVNKVVGGDDGSR